MIAIGNLYRHRKRGSVYYVVGLLELDSEMCREDDELLFIVNFTGGALLVRADDQRASIDQIVFRERFRVQAEADVNRATTMILYRTVETPENKSPRGCGYARPFDEFNDGRFELTGSDDQ